MRCSILNLACCALVLTITVHYSRSHPVSTLDQAEIVEIVPLNDQISVASETQLSERNKRTIGMFRTLFPQLSEIIDKKVEEIVQYFVRIIGKAVLQGGIFGGGGGGSDDDSESRDASSSSSSSSSSGGAGRRVSITLPTFPPDLEGDEDEDDDSASKDSSSSSTTTSSSVAQLETSESDRENSLAGAESQKNEVRVPFNQDQETSASGGNVEGLSPAEDLSDVNTEDDENRNKRFLSFGFGGDSSGSSGGGSGNFLFDIIRSTADRAARAAGTIYRVVAGTESLNLGTMATNAETTILQPDKNPPGNPSHGGFLQKLVAGSGSSESSDEAANNPESGKSDSTYQEGIPGPITRLIVIANRGLSNLIQDLILRLAQTSERLVNFKARLITSLI